MRIHELVAALRELNTAFEKAGAEPPTKITVHRHTFDGLRFDAEVSRYVACNAGIVEMTILGVRIERGNAP